MWAMLHFNLFTSFLMDCRCRNVDILSQIYRTWDSKCGPFRKWATSGLQTSFCETERGPEVEVTWLHQRLGDRWGWEGDPTAPIPPAQLHSQGLSSKMEGCQWKLKKSFSWGNLRDTGKTQCCSRAQGPSVTPKAETRSFPVLWGDSRE